MSSSRIATLAALVLAAAALIPATALGVARSAGTHVVTLREFRFHPGTLTINHGDSVKWVWQDQVEHNVTFHGFRSRTQVHGTYTVRFTRRGTYNYHCTIHVSEGMRGKVVVR
jgi:plastocyanin